MDVSSLYRYFLSCSSFTLLGCLAWVIPTSASSPASLSVLRKSLDAAVAHQHLAFLFRHQGQSGCETIALPSLGFRPSPRPSGCGPNASWI